MSSLRVSTADACAVGGPAGGCAAACASSSASRSCSTHRWGRPAAARASGPSSRCRTRGRGRPRPSVGRWARSTSTSSGRARRGVRRLPQREPVRTGADGLGRHRHLPRRPAGEPNASNVRTHQRGRREGGPGGRCPSRPGWPRSSAWSSLLGGLAAAPGIGLGGLAGGTRAAEPCWACAARTRRPAGRGRGVGAGRPGHAGPGHAGVRRRRARRGLRRRRAAAVRADAGGARRRRAGPGRRRRTRGEADRDRVQRSVPGSTARRTPSSCSCSASTSPRRSAPGCWRSGLVRYAVRGGRVGAAVDARATCHPRYWRKVVTADRGDRPGLVAAADVSPAATYAALGLAALLLAESFGRDVRWLWQHGGASRRSAGGGAPDRRGWPRHEAGRADGVRRGPAARPAWRRTRRGSSSGRRAS